jgi:hypothetical protein
MESEFRQQDESVHVPGTEHREVTMVQRRKLWFAESLHHGEDRSVDVTDVCVGVAVTERPHPGVVLRLQVLDEIRAASNVVQKHDEHAGIETLVDPVVDFDEHGRGNDERLGRAFDEFPASKVIGVTSIEGREDRSCVED